MRQAGRFCQMVALAMPLVAIVLQIADRLTVGRMLIVAVSAFSLFYIGRIIEGYARR